MKTEKIMCSVSAKRAATVSLPAIFSILLLFSFSANAQGMSDYAVGYPTFGIFWDKVTGHLLWGFLGLIVGGAFAAFLSDRFRQFRRIILLGLVVFVVCAGGYMQASIGDNLAFVAAIIAGWIIFSNRHSEKSTTFGSAEWANYQHLVDNKLAYQSGEHGLVLGFFHHFTRGNVTPIPLHYTGNRHLLTVAPTRSGKGVSSIVPNLLMYDGSAIIIDPKGENARITAPRRADGDPELKIAGLGQAVHVVDPWGITGFDTSCFNPLDWLDINDIDISENAMMLADAIVTPRPGDSDPFWDEEAKALLMGLLLYVATEELEQDNRHLGRVRDIIVASKEVFNAFLDRMKESDHPIVKTTAERTAGKEEKLLSGILASLQSHTHFLDSPRIRESLSRSDFRFEDLKKQKMTIYLVLPADRLATFGRWLRILIQQAITVNARNIEDRPEKPILFLLDEMPALGRLTMVEQAYSLMAGFGMQLWGIVQDLSQLEQIYGKGWETFIGNSGVLQYFGSRDEKTAGYFSKLCGVTTIQKFSFTRGIARAMSSMSSGSSTTHSESTTSDVVQRQLAYPDELMVMHGKRQLIFVENFNPISGHRLRWYEDPALKAHGISQEG